MGAVDAGHYLWRPLSLLEGKNQAQQRRLLILLLITTMEVAANVSPVYGRCDIGQLLLGPCLTSPQRYRALMSNAAALMAPACVLASLVQPCMGRIFAELWGKRGMRGWRCLQRRRGYEICIHTHTHTHGYA
jgi:hypothetical protein